MRFFWIVLATLAICSPGDLAAQEQAGIEEHGPLELESYYEIKWGHVGEFVRLYKKNHLPILEALKEKGIIQEIEIHYPIQHLAGPQPWNMRVRITFRDTNVGMLGSAHTEWVAVQSELYPDIATFQSEEKRRMSLLKSHWDVAVYQE